MQLTNFKTFLDTNQISYKKDYLLKYETYFKMGGKVNSFVIPNNIDEFILVITYLRNNDLEFKTIGLTTNVYFLDELEYSVIISTKNLTSLQIMDDVIQVECGYSLQEFVRVTLLEQSSGYEGLEGIPGSIGGAIVMNAGAYGYTISDHIISVTCLTSEKETITLNKTETHFSHRNSIFKINKDWIVLSAQFKLTKAKSAVIAKKIETFHIARHTYQEFSYPNLGSLFSIKGDFYTEFFTKNKTYSTMCFMLKVVYKNPLTKFIMRKNPNNTVFNKLVQRYLLPSSIEHRYSGKSMNILINDGISKTDQLLDYISLLKENLKAETPIENEIVIGPIIKENDKIKNIIDKIKSRGLLT